MKLHIFNPENDLALADGGANYCPPPAAAQIAYDLAALPLWFATPDDRVILPDNAHLEYYRRISSLFDVASPFECDDCDSVTSCLPWGWSAQIKRRLDVMGLADVLPTDMNIARIRELSHRKTSILILTALRDAGVDIPSLPMYFTNIVDVVDFIKSRPRCVVKAPWSGSGKGIAWGIGHVEPPMEHFCKGVIRRQGGVLCEEFLNIRAEFAMEFYADEMGVEFAGYSLFNSFKGSYSGNVLACDVKIEEFLAGLVPIEKLVELKSLLPGILYSLLDGSGYVGYLGVDMMVYDDNGCLRLNPCMELNLRMNMGVASRLFFDKHVNEGSVGVFRVRFFKNATEAYAAHTAEKDLFPLEIKGGKIVSGYLELSPVMPETRYSVSVIIYENGDVGKVYCGE